MAPKPQVKCKCRRIAAFPIRPHRRREDWRLPHASEVEQFARRGRTTFETANAIGRLSDQCRFLAKSDFQLKGGAEDATAEVRIAAGAHDSACLMRPRPGK
jgi:hypothetical protein